MKLGIAILAAVIVVVAALLIAGFFLGWFKKSETPSASSTTQAASTQTTPSAPAAKETPSKEAPPVGEEAPVETPPVEEAPPPVEFTECGWDEWGGCEDGKLRYCEDGKLGAAKIACGYPGRCDEENPNICMVPEQGCTADGVMICQNNSLYECVDGKKSLVEQCRHGCDLNGQSCKRECNWPGNLYDQASNTLRFCDSDGNITKRTTCAYGYDASANKCKTKFMGYRLSFNNNGNPMYLVARRITKGSGTVDLTNNINHASIFQKVQSGNGVKYTIEFDYADDPDAPPYALVGNGDKKTMWLLKDRATWSGYWFPFWEDAPSGSILRNKTNYLGQPWGMVAGTSGPIQTTTPATFHYQIAAPDLGMNTLKLNYITNPRVIARYGVNIEEVITHPPSTSDPVVAAAPPPRPPTEEELALAKLTEASVQAQLSSFQMPSFSFGF